MSTKKKQLNVKGFLVSLDSNDYINITDIAKSVSEGKPAYTIQNWMKNTQTIRYLFAWEKLHNDKIKVVHLDDLLNIASDNRLILSVEKWISTVGAVGLFQKKGRGGGTFAHSEIALDFAYWLSPEFKVYLNNEFLRLKEEEAKRLKLNGQMHIRLITDKIDDVRNLLDTIPDQDPRRNRLNYEEEDE